MNKSEESNICKELIKKYPDLKEYKTANRLKVQKSNIDKILEIITDEEDKNKFKEFLELYNSRKGKSNTNNSENENDNENNNDNENDNDNDNGNLKAISLFSGMGGDSVGMVNAGLELVAYSECEQEMRNTHELNFPDTKLIGNGNILQTTDEEFLEYKNVVDVIFAGFPCQGFSNAGNKDPNDPRNSLFREFVRSAKLIKPKYVIGENVKGLLDRKTATGEEYMNIIKSEFDKIGYDIDYKVYMCSKLDINVPQNRVRLIIVGIRKDIVKIRKDLNQTFTFPEEIYEEKTGNLKNIIKFTMEGTLKVEPEYLDFDFDDIPDECIIKDLDNDESENNPHPNLVQYAKKRDYTRAGVDRPHRLHFGKRLDVGGEIIDIRKPINTIICAYGHCPRFFIPQKNKNGNYIRCLTPDELKQCQGFPSYYEISGDRSKKIKQIGNAVPPPLIEMIVKELIK